MKDDLRKLALAATPGPWEVWTSNSFRRITGSDMRDGHVLHGLTQPDGQGDLGGSNRDADLAYIAAANPATVLALLDELAALKAARDEACDIAQSWAEFRAEWRLSPVDCLARIAALRKVGQP